MRHWSLDDWTRFLFSFDGRASRSEFWRLVLLMFGVNLLTGFVQGFFGGFSQASGTALPSALVRAGGFVAFLIGVASFVARLAVGARRLHDRGINGWYQAMPLAMLALGTVMLGIGAVTGGHGASNPILVLAIGSFAFALVLGLWIWIQMGFLKGDDGPNRYGADPLR